MMSHSRADKRHDSELPKVATNVLGRRDHIGSSVALARDVEALLHPERFASGAFPRGGQLVTELFVEPSGVDNRGNVDLFCGRSVSEIGLGTSDQAGPEACSLRVRGYV